MQKLPLCLQRHSEAWLDVVSLLRFGCACRSSSIIICQDNQLWRFLYHRDFAEPEHLASDSAANTAMTSTAHTQSDKCKYATMATWKQRYRQETVCERNWMRGVRPTVATLHLGAGINRALAVTDPYTVLAHDDRLMLVYNGTGTLMAEFVNLPRSLVQRLWQNQNLGHQDQPVAANKQRILITPIQEHTLATFDAATGDRICVFESPKEHKERGWTLSLLAVTETHVICKERSSVLVWQADTGRICGEIPFLCSGSCYNAAAYNTQMQLLVVVTASASAPCTKQNKSSRNRNKNKSSSKQDSVILSIHRLTAPGELKLLVEQFFDSNKTQLTGGFPVVYYDLWRCGVWLCITDLVRTNDTYLWFWSVGTQQLVRQKQRFRRAVQGLIPRRHGVMIICPDALWFVPCDRAGITGQARHLGNLDTEPYGPVRYWHNDQRMVCATGSTIRTYVFGE